MTKGNETSEQRQKRKLDEELDRQLEQTFPASDPVAIPVSKDKPTTRRVKEDGFRRNIDCCA